MSPGEPLRALADFPANVLAFVADALALVWLGRAHLSDLCRGLSDLLLVDALDDDLRIGRNLERDPLRRLDHNWMRIADVQPEIRALQSGAVADSLQLETLLETLRNALDHVGDERACQTVQRPILAALGRTGNGDRAVRLLDLHPGRHLLLQ